MTTLLNEVEARVLGALAEKQVTTPEYYPLTLNALVAACNQKNNRHPVSSLDEATVEDAVESLREKNLAYVFYGSTSRVPKYKHLMTEILRLSAGELALLTVLMLRGPQTVGELRERAGRMHEFAG
ncbi:MAG TPA: YceH family protein, partial [Pyrinomonadaceae bacterium]|nr:YceH family protein [Pyrinomonadaceae bacterium]